MYARTRNDKQVVPVGIFYLVIPKALMADAVQVVGSDFRELVWHNRLQEPLPTHLELYGEASVLVGPLTWRSSQSITDLKSDGYGWQASELLRIHHEEAATQYCVQDPSLLRRMNEQGRICVTAYEDPAGRYLTESQMTL